MDENELVFVDRWATCLTADCGNYGASIHVLAPESGAVGCGVCGEEITDIDDIQPTEGTVLPQWILDQLATQNSTN